MEPVWIAISISALVVIMVLLLISRRKGNQIINPSNLFVLGMSFVVLGIIFGDERVIGYSIAISIIAMVVIMVLLLISRRKSNQLINPSNLFVLGMSFVVLGIIFGDERVIGYSFIGVGVLLSVIDAIRNRKQ